MTAAETIPTETSFDSTLWRVEWDTIWAPHEWACGAQMSVSHQDSSDAWHSRLVRLDYDRVTEAIAQRAPYASVYVGLGVLRGDVTQGRGGKADVIGVPALWADIDIAGRGHKSSELPDETTAMRMVADLPLRPTLLMHSGGGLYPILALDELLLPSSEEHMMLMRRWDQLIQTTAERYGSKIDKGVARDPARVIRALGTTNRKEQLARPTRLLARNPACRYSVGDLDDALPELVAQPRRPRRPLAVVVAPETADDDLGDDDRPGTALAVSYPVGDFLTSVLAWKREGERMIVPREDGSYAEDDTHAQLYDGEDGVQRVTVFGARGQEMLGLDDSDHSLSSWDVLILVCGGDAGLAARIALRFGPDHAGLDAFLREHRSPEALAEAVPAEPTAGRLAPPARSTAMYAVSGDPVPWRTALAAGTGWTPIHTDPTRRELLFARAGYHCGLWLATERAIENDLGKRTWTFYERITDWVPWREAVTRTRHGNVEVADPEYRVEVLTVSGQTCSIGLSARESLSAAAIQEATGAAIALPDSLAGTNRIRTALAELGADERRDDVRYDSTGWVVDGAGRWVFGAPAGSVAAAGIRHDLTVVAPEGSLPEARTGWDRVPTSQDEHRDGLRAMAAMLSVAPGRLDWGVAHVGALCAAPLGLSRRTTVVVHAEKGAAKSLAMSVPYSAISSVGLDGASFPVYIPSASIAGAIGALVWHRHLTCCADDYRRQSQRGSQSANSTATGVFGTIAQGSYTGAPEKKKTQGGQLRATASIECVGCVTAEVLTTETALVERCATIALRGGDVDNADGGAVDQFRALWAETGIVRMGYAGYLQWLARHLDGEWAGLSGMARVWDDKRRWHYGRYSASRAGEAIATLATGWTALYAYADSVGAASALPEKATVARVLRQMVETTSAEHKAADPGPIMVKALRDMIESNRGHVTAHDGDVPGARALASGYERRETGGEAGYVWQASRNVLGRYSDDYQFILLTTAGLEAAQRHAKLDGLDARQIQAKVAGMCVEGTHPGDKVPGRYGIGDRNSRPRGYLVHASVLGLGREDDEPAPPEPDAGPL